MRINAVFWDEIIHNRPHKRLAIIIAKNKVKRKIANGVKNIINTALKNTNNKSLDN